MAEVLAGSAHAGPGRSRRQPGRHPCRTLRWWRNRKAGKGLSCFGDDGGSSGSSAGSVAAGGWPGIAGTPSPVRLRSRRRPSSGFRSGASDGPEPPIKPSHADSAGLRIILLYGSVGPCASVAGHRRQSASPHWESIQLIRPNGRRGRPRRRRSRACAGRHLGVVGTAVRAAPTCDAQVVLWQACRQERAECGGAGRGA